MRKVDIVAVKNGSIEINLRELGYSSSICSRLRKRMGLIEVNNKACRIVDSIEKNTIFSIYLEDDNKREIIPYKDIDINILYEDDDLAVIDKPANLAVISTREHFGKSLENVLAAKWGEFVYRPVNRLDRDTSGLMIVAKNQLAHSYLSKEHINRKYLALCDGVFEGEGVIDAKIDRKEGSIMERCVKDTGKEAITYYKVLKTFSSYSLVELTLKTGRTHQIRVHMAYINHPLLGDGLYNKNARKEMVLDNGFVLKRQALHSSYLSFIQPITQKEICIESKPEFV